ncbi:MAG: dTDP-4-dehydrorhamnose 3,5-epimerase [Halieaceae bacterium]|nr:dTDP-4-dehydrorhamnose 3,5-epimerase [Halieaceae bacterium]
MELLSEPLPGVLHLRARSFNDTRGSFSETFSRRTMAGFGVDHEFVQDNEAFSATRGTVRGLHLQADPHAQGKLVRVLRGSIFDVALDIRPDSPTFRRHTSVELSEGDGQALWIPAGFAHGFCTLADHTVVAYKVTDFYAPDAERSIRFDDPELGIAWPIEPARAVLSEKDAAAPSFAAVLEEMN